MHRPYCSLVFANQTKVDEAISMEYRLECSECCHFPENSPLWPRRLGVSPDFPPCLQGENTKGGIFIFRGGEATQTIPVKAGMTEGRFIASRFLNHQTDSESPPSKRLLSGRQVDDYAAVETLDFVSAPTLPKDTLVRAHQPVGEVGFVDEMYEAVGGAGADGGVGHPFQR